MSKKRVLIVENIYGEFNSVKKSLAHFFGDQIEVLPGDVSGTDYNDHDELINAFKIGPEKFQDILDFFGEVDLYVLDIALDGEQDNLGIEFFKFLRSKSKVDFETIFISQTSKTALPLPEDGTFEFISKRDYGREFPNQVAAKIQEIFNLQNLTELQSSILIDGQEEEDNFRQNKSISSRISSRYKSLLAFGKKRAIYNAVEITSEFSKIAILDVVIRFVFYLLIIFTTTSSLINISWAILVSLSPIFKWTYFVDPNQKALPTMAMLPLLTAESIFLNMLPIFIVFGFFNYYETNVREYFLRGNLQKISDEISTKPINVSKVLFISSMISYLFIKIIESISELNHSSNKVDNMENHTIVPIDLISYSAVLLILLGYFVYLNREHHSTNHHTN